MELALVCKTAPAVQLQALFQRICRERGMLSTPEACFAFLNELPEKYSQMSLFDL